MAYLITPDGKLLSNHGRHSVSYVPFLLGKGFAYLDQPNRFLRERATGRWRPDIKQASPFAKPATLGVATIRSYAEDLTNLWTYLEERTDGRATAEQLRDLLAEYKAEMVDGRWSAEGSGLAASTVRRRLTVATQFLNWVAGSEGGHLIVPAARKRVPIVRTPAAKPRPKRLDPQRLRLPDKEEIDLWLAEVERQRGPTAALGCRVILNAGTRLEETTLLRYSNLPDLDQLAPMATTAKMFVEHGTKGERNPLDASKKGKSRWTRISVSFLRRLSDYASLRRVVAVRRYRLTHATEPVELLLDDETGKPFTPEQLYRAWHDCVSLPYPGFSPHLGRHYFACSRLLELLDEQARALPFGSLAAAEAGWVRTTCLDLIRFHIRPALGHFSDETTARYLGWVEDHVSVAAQRGAWSARLDG